MKKKSILTLAVCALSLSAALPSYAGILKEVGSLFGSVTSTLVDIPEGTLVYSLYRTPVKTINTLADKFGDKNGLEQNAAATLIGLPVGVLWGIPEGAIRGGKHGWSTGWDKPFSTDSFIVSEEK